MVALPSNGEPRPPYRTARRAWVGRELPGIGTLELTWACCGVDYPRLIEGHASAIVYNHSKPWAHLAGSLLVQESGGWIGSNDGRPFAPQELGGGLVSAPDRTTYDAVVAALRA
jgi:hypothetical protein